MTDSIIVKTNQPRGSDKLARSRGSDHRRGILRYRCGNQA